jgi:hypothetical protein
MPNGVQDAFRRAAGRENARHHDVGVEYGGYHEFSCRMPRAARAARISPSIPI